MGYLKLLIRIQKSSLLSKLKVKKTPRSSRLGCLIIFRKADRMKILDAYQNKNRLYDRPAVSSYEKILELIDAGMNVARLNFSHGTHEDHLKVIADLKKAREEKKVPLALMLDTKGPEIRIGLIKNGSVPLEAGQNLLLVKESMDPIRYHVGKSVCRPALFRSLSRSDHT